MEEILELINLIKEHNKTEEVIKILTSDFEYYNSILLDSELIKDYKKITTRTTFLGIATLYANIEVINALLQAGVPADGMDLFLYRTSLYEKSNYRPLNQPKIAQGKSPFSLPVLNENEKYWSTQTEVLDIWGERIISIPWSTPAILAILSENAECLKLLLEYGAVCDLRYPYYANALSLCENEEVLEVLLQSSGTYMKDTIADVLMIFNVPLAKYLYNLGIKPDTQIIKKISDRNKSSSYLGFGGEYEINDSSKGWEEFYQKRSEECIDFYSSISYSDNTGELWEILSELY